MGSSRKKSLQESQSDEALREDSAMSTTMLFMCLGEKQLCAFSLTPPSQIQTQKAEQLTSLILPPVQQVDTHSISNDYETTIMPANSSNNTVFEDHLQPSTLIQSEEPTIPLHAYQDFAPMLWQDPIHNWAFTGDDFGC